MMSKLVMLLLMIFAFSGCGALHDGNGWEHNMDQESDELFEHKH
ncbi:MAG: hypothetical protein Q9M19_07425 [Mariprofundaceae bacterium]|nr:hypothetical protein [Mariprofundaceae bacterium]